MSGIRIVEGVDPEDRVAFGLTAPRLLVAAAGLVLAMACWSAPLPLPVRMPLTALVALMAAGLAWGHTGGRPALDWAPLLAGYALRRWEARPRADPALPLARRRRAGSDAAPAPGPPGRGRPGGRSPCPPFLGGTRRVVLFSLRGGVGRTTLATELAVLLARDGRVRAGAVRPRPLRVALLDLDLDAGSVAARLACSGPTLADLLAAGSLVPARVRRALVHPPGSRLRVLCAPPRVPEDRSDRLVAQVVDVLHALDGVGVEVAVVDVGPGLGPLAQRVLAAAHDVVVVVADGPTAEDDAGRALDALKRLGLGARVQLVRNRCATEAVGGVGAAAAIRVAADPRLERAVRTRIPAVLDGSRPPPRGLLALAESLLPTVLDRPDAGVAGAPVR